MPTAAAVVTPIISASPDEKEIPGCVELQDVTKYDPSIAHPPVVDLRVFTQPAQSLFVNTSNSSILPCHPYFHTNLGLSNKYLKSLFIFFLSPTVGFGTLHTSFTAN